MNTSENIARNGGETMNREAIGEAAEAIVSEINQKRKQDTLLMDKIREKLNNQVERIMQGIEEKLYKMYEKNSAETQTKLDSLWTVLHNIEQLECEINTFKMALKGFYRDVVDASDI